MDNSFLRITYEASNDLLPTKQIDGFFPVFDEKLPEPLSMAAIIGISVGLSLLMIIIAVLIVIAVIWRRKGFKKNQKNALDNPYAVDPSEIERPPSPPRSGVMSTRPTLAVVRVEDAPVIETVVQQKPPIRVLSETSSEDSSQGESTESVQAVGDGALSFFFEMDSEYD
jgi:hypothetical protein